MFGPIPRHWSGIIIAVCDTSCGSMIPHSRSSWVPRRLRSTIFILYFAHYASGSINSVDRNTILTWSYSFSSYIIQQHQQQHRTRCVYPNRELASAGNHKHWGSGGIWFAALFSSSSLCSSRRCCSLPLSYWSFDQRRKSWQTIILDSEKRTYIWGGNTPAAFQIT